MTCGFVNPLKKRPVTKSKTKPATVLYPDGIVTKGWVSSGGDCHGTSDGCHGKSNISSGGCHNENRSGCN